MIISHSKSVAFWKIPRTGSSNVEMILRLIAGLDTTQDVIAETHFFPVAFNFDNMPDMANGAPGRRRAHITPQTAIDNGFLTLAQYNAYQNFCMVRDPVDKFVSLHALAFPQDEFHPANIWRNIRGAAPTDAIFRAQSEWLMLGNITPLPFSDYENSVRTIITAFGAAQPDALPWVNRENPSVENFQRSIVTPAQDAQIRAFYPSDASLVT